MTGISLNLNSDNGFKTELFKRFLPILLILAPCALSPLISLHPAFYRSLSIAHSTFSFILVSNAIAFNANNLLLWLLFDCWFYQFCSISLYSLNLFSLFWNVFCVSYTFIWCVKTCESDSVLPQPEPNGAYVYLFWFHTLVETIHWPPLIIQKKVSIFVAVLILIRIRFGCLCSSTGSIITQFIWRHIAHTTYIRAHENALHWRARTKPFASATAADPMLRRSSTHVPYRCYTSFILCNHSMPTLIHRFNAQCWIHLTYKQTCSFCSFRSFDLRQIKYFSFVFLIESNNSG